MQSCLSAEIINPRDYGWFTLVANLFLPNCHALLAISAYPPAPFPPSCSYLRTMIRFNSSSSLPPAAPLTLAAAILAHAQCFRTGSGRRLRKVEIRRARRCRFRVRRRDIRRSGDVARYLAVLISTSTRHVHCDLLLICEWYADFVIPNRVQHLQRLRHPHQIRRIIQIQKRPSQHRRLHLISTPSSTEPKHSPSAASSATPDLAPTPPPQCTYRPPPQDPP